ncbi:hypothetical protein CRE_25702 [Caenorhabditis remanei]|uniref:RRM domain-containing protein n=1 Tax=Caenorhabditis remanei TaxID=31234 RepID=E3ML67_CAERE|nr:hypothetical protein CRE_25702 [Caenorhabditis remanei]
MVKSGSPQESHRFCKLYSSFCKLIRSPQKKIFEWPPPPTNLAPRNHQHLHRGIGYIDYESVEDAEKSIKYMDGGQVDGQVIQVEMTIGGRAYVPGQRRVSPFRRRASPPPRDRKSPIRRGGGGRSPPTFRRRSPMAGGRRSPMGGRGSGANNAPLGPSRFRRGGSRSRSPVGRRSRS